MSEMRLQLAELTKSLFGPNVNSARDVERAALEILLIFSSIKELDSIFRNLAVQSSTSSLQDAASDWSKLLGKINPHVQGCSSQSNSKLPDVEARIAWKRVQLISNELQLHVIRLRAKNASSKESLTNKDHLAQTKLHDNLDQLKEDIQKLQRKQTASVVPQTPPPKPKAEPDQIPTPKPVPNPLPKPAPKNSSQQTPEEVQRLRQQIELYQVDEASRLKKAGKYKEALKIYRELHEKKNAEAEQKRTHGEKGATETENFALQYQLAVAEVLHALQYWSQAEDTARLVWERSKKLLGLDDQLTFSAQRQMCASLRSQGTEEKLELANWTYTQVWKPSIQKAKLGDHWVLENGVELAIVLEEQKAYQEAETQYEKVWNISKKALGENDKTTSQVAWRLAKLLVKQKKAEKAIPALEECFHAGEAVRADALKLAWDLGDSLFEQNQRSTTAETCLRMAWLETKNRNQKITSKVLSGAWRLSRILYDKEKYQEAKSILEKLRDANIAGPATSPTKLQIDALLAWIYRHLKEWSQAKKFARWVWSQDENQDVLDPSLSTGANLIWILCQQQEKVTPTWEEMLRRKKASLETCTAENRKLTAKCWQSLADELEKEGKTKTAQKMRIAAKLLR